MLLEQKKKEKMAITISNIRNRTRLPKLGVVRLGVKDASGRPQEVGHFILDIEDPDLRDKSRVLYGDKPEVLDITFFSDRTEDVFRCTYNRWVKDKGVSRLICEGDGVEAVERGQKRSCPCPALGKECQRKTVLKFLLPELTKAGYFLLATRSINNADNIETGLNLVQQSMGALTKTVMRLRRTTGYADVNGARIKKYYVALESRKLLPVTPVPVPEIKPTLQAVRSPEASAAIDEKTGELISIGNILRLPDAATLARQQDRRLREGRQKVKEKIKVYIMEPGVDAALQQYACSRFSKRRYEDLTVDELIELWHSIDDDRNTVGDIYSIVLSNKRTATCT